MLKGARIFKMMKISADQKNLNDQRSTESLRKP
jgi:hypothetical protein